MTTFAFDRISRASLALEARYEFLRLLRTPSFALPTLIFPAMFYLLFGVLMNMGKSFQAAHYLMATYCVFGVMSPGLFGFGVTVAMEREQGLLLLKRALPMPPANYLAAKLAMALIFATAIFLLLAVLGSTVGGVRLEVYQWAQLGMVSLLGVLPFCALGLLLGTLVSGSGAPAVANLIYLPMAFLSGLAIPLFMMPSLVQKLAPAWPAWHLGQLALAAIGQPNSGSAIGHVAYLLVLTVVSFVIANRRLARVG